MIWKDCEVTRLWKSQVQDRLPSPSSMCWVITLCRVAKNTPDPATCHTSSVQPASPENRFWFPWFWGGPVNYKLGPRVKNKKHFQRAYCDIIVVSLLPVAKATELPSPKGMWRLEEGEKKYGNDASRCPLLIYFDISDYYFDSAHLFSPGDKASRGAGRVCQGIFLQGGGSLSNRSPACCLGWEAWAEPQGGENARGQGLEWSLRDFGENYRVCRLGKWG